MVLWLAIRVAVLREQLRILTVARLPGLSADVHIVPFPE